MKALKATLLPFLSIGCGGLALSLRFILNSSRDELGLLPNGHICSILAYVLMVLFLVTLGLCVRSLAPMSSYKALFPASQIRATGCALAAIGFLYAGICSIGEGGVVGTIMLVLGILCTLSMSNIALARLAGLTPNGWLHMLPVVFLMGRAVLQVRQWSATIQTAAYIFPLLASIFLMLAAYYHANLNIRKKGRRWFVFSSQAALFFCLGALADNDPVFYLTMAGWMACDLCITTNPQKRNPAQEEQA